MLTNNIFSFKRFLMLFRQGFRFNKKMIAVTVVGFIGIVFLILLLMQMSRDFNNWSNRNSMGVFIMLFFTLGIIYTSNSFPSFRSSGKTISYLMLPASASEKYLFEFLTRIVGFVLLMPVFFWLAANIEGVVIHLFIPGLEEYKFSFAKAWQKFHGGGGKTGWDIMAIVQSCLFVFVAAFTGASHFSKSPLLKSVFTFSLLFGGFFLFGYLAWKGLNLDEYHLQNNQRILFLKKGNETMCVSLAILGINLSLLAISWFRLKEKEV
jgi:hypothetical protein